MFKNFLLKKMIKSQMGSNVSDEQVDAVVAIVEKNPELFKKIGEEIKSEIDKGKDQMTATMEIMRKYEGELKNLK
jgi:hypothetical protein